MTIDPFPRIISARDALSRILIPLDDEKLSDTVREIIRAVRQDGDRALVRLTERFDGVRIREVWARKEKKRLPAGLREAMETAFSRIFRYHAEFASQSRISADDDGVTWGRVVRPIRRVGIYVPGGSAPLFSTLLMAAGAARAAGVKELAVATPPPIDGAIFAAAEIAEISEIYQVGGAQAVAAMAFGTKTIRPVDKIVGPGNRFVTEAKRQVYGYVGIDSLAGPTEILIIADDGASPAIVAADMIAQAEHAIDARSILVTTSSRLAKRVQSELAAQLKSLPRADIAAVSLKNRGAIVQCTDMNEMITVANAAAPEHLSIQTAEPMAVADEISAAGAIFLGSDSSEALGDYIAGPNHILPTFGTARYAGPLSTDDFQCTSSIQEFSESARRKLTRPAALMARAEGLEGHARSLEIRDAVTKTGRRAKSGKKPAKTKKKPADRKRKTKRR